MNIRDRIKELRRVRAGDLRPNPRNWRTHPQAQRDALRGVLAEIGYADALIARELPDGGLELLDGHLRAETTPDSEVPVLITDLTDAEASKLLATLDPLAAMAEADKGKLDELLRDVQTSSEAVAAMLTNLAASNGILSGGGEVVEDEVPEPPAVPVTKLGDLWLLGEHRLLCGDSRDSLAWERLTCGAEINVCMTSPPYASQRKYDESSGFKPISPDEYVEWWEPLQQYVREHLASDGSFFVNIKPNAEGLDTELYVFDLVCAMVRQWDWHFATELCWERTGIPKSVSRRFKNQFEPIYQFGLGEWKMRPKSVAHSSSRFPKPRGKGAGNTSWAEHQGSNWIHMSGHQGESGFQWFGDDVGEGMAYPGNRLPTFAGSHEATGHAAAFPVGLPSFFFKAYSDEGDNVADPFMGSGSSLIAAEQLHRRCYGIEISPQYCDVVVKRWETLTGKKAKLEKSHAPKLRKKTLAAT